MFENLLGNNTKSPHNDTGCDIVDMKNICQSYTDNNKKITIFDNLDFKINDYVGSGQFTTILGSSGCGKSTLLRYIAGLQKPDSGTINILGKEQANNDRIGMVFQQYSSLPWRTVLENIMLPLEIKGINQEEREHLAMEMVNLVGLNGHENKYAQYPILSGGQLQRVALARNLILKEKILLLDEPHGALDMRTKLEMDDLLFNIWTKIMKDDPTFILVTHDINEAVYLSNEIIIMGSKPSGYIAERIQIDLPYTNKEIKKDKRYIDYVAHIENTMMNLNS